MQRQLEEIIRILQDSLSKSSSSLLTLGSIATADSNNAKIDVLSSELVLLISGLTKASRLVNTCVSKDLECISTIHDLKSLILEQKKALKELTLSRQKVVDITAERKEEGTQSEVSQWVCNFCQAQDFDTGKSSKEIVQMLRNCEYVCLRQSAYIVELESTVNRLQTATRDAQSVIEAQNRWCNLLQLSLERYRKNENALSREIRSRHLDSGGMQDTYDEPCDYNDDADERIIQSTSEFVRTPDNDEPVMLNMSTSYSVDNLSAAPPMVPLLDDAGVIENMSMHPHDFELPRVSGQIESRENGQKGEINDEEGKGGHSVFASVLETEKTEAPHQIDSSFLCGGEIIKEANKIDHGSIRFDAVGEEEVVLTDNYIDGADAYEGDSVSMQSSSVDSSLLHFFPASVDSSLLSHPTPMPQHSPGSPPQISHALSDENDSPKTPRWLRVLRRRGAQHAQSGESRDSLSHSKSVIIHTAADGAGCETRASEVGGSDTSLKDLEIDDSFSLIRNYYMRKSTETQATQLMLSSEEGEIRGEYSANVV